MTLPPAEVQQLIEAAGSPQEAIIRLLKEKHALANQNTSLWKLVEKQRPMLIGLNRDLDLAVRDKELYRKRLKELYATFKAHGSSVEEGDSLSAADISRHLRRLQHMDTKRPGDEASKASGESKHKTQDKSAASEPQPIKPRKKSGSRSLSISLPEKLHRSSTHPGNPVAGQTPLTSFWKRHKEEHQQPDERGVAASSNAPTEGAASHPNPRSPISLHSPNGSSGKFSLVTSRARRNSQVIWQPADPQPHINRAGTADSTSTADSSGSQRRPSMPEMSKGSKDRRSSDKKAHTDDRDKVTTGRQDGLAEDWSKPHIRIASPFPGASRIYTGLVSNDFPDLLVPPTSLHCIDIRVASSRMRPRRHNYLSTPSKQTDDDTVFTLGAFYRHSEGDSGEGCISPTLPVRELWRVEKSLTSLIPLDHTLKTLMDFPERLPDRATFNGHSPAKIDARRAALNAFFSAALTAITGPQGNVAAQMEMCQFLSTDVIEPRDDESSLIEWKRGKHNLTSIIYEKPGKPGADDRPKMEGYLTKRGKNFGGWKARYFVLHSPKLMYYECPGGTHLGTIKIKYAQIGKQSADDPQLLSNIGSPGAASGHDDSENQYRHAFLILEPKRRDSNALVRHVLCAESDEERDAWVEALLAYVEDKHDDDSAGHSNWKTATKDGRPISSSSSVTLQKKMERSSPVDSDVSIPEGAAKRSLSFDSLAETANAMGSVDTLVAGRRGDEQQQQRNLHAHFQISKPTNGSVIRDASTWGNVAPVRNGATPLKEKKRSIWGFNRSGPVAPAVEDKPQEVKEPVTPVFGLAIADAVQLCAPTQSAKGMASGLPAVAYRCVEYLRAHNADEEEGIFRLSGSNIVVRQLRDRFNAEGDVDLLSEEYTDVHAVASLFKQYLRELPESLVTRDLHFEYYKVLELPDHNKKLAAFTTLFNLLPPPNKALLVTLMELLSDIVKKCELNRMTVRNVGIVFAPTLNIPAPVISMFLNEFDALFHGQSGACTGGRDNGSGNDAADESSNAETSTIVEDQDSIDPRATTDATATAPTTANADVYAREQTESLSSSDAADTAVQSPDTSISQELRGSSEPDLTKQAPTTAASSAQPAPPAQAPSAASTPPAPFATTAPLSGAAADSPASSPHTTAVRPAVSPSSSSSPMIDPLDQGLADASRLAPLASQGPRRGRDKRATINGLNGLLAPPGGDSAKCGSDDSCIRQKRRESGVIFMDTSRLDLLKAAEKIAR
ncbi:hypothetical protein KEM52_003231 [Ascosphaera acerosa]|nr:hypothetical protein KEM52_003231 [Ascosphaera acerosa]